MKRARRDHGGGIDAAALRFGGNRIDWIDLSTGINPVPYPITDLPNDCWTALPDSQAEERLLQAARAFWKIPDAAEVVAAPGASVLISLIPGLRSCGRVTIPTPTYNEHAAAFENHGWQCSAEGSAKAQVVVHPNNPDGRIWTADTLPSVGADLTVIDESFCDVAPEISLSCLSTHPGTIILKSFGKFWGLAGLRLGFAFGDPNLVATLKSQLGPWAVAGPALHIGATALEDAKWPQKTRLRLEEDRARLDAMMLARGAELAGGTTLFSLYKVDSAERWQTKLAHHHIWTRAFPYNAQWLRVGLPNPSHWARLEAALA